MLNRYLRALPWFLAIAHALFTIAIYWFTLANFERAALLPIFVYFVDLPASILIELIRTLLGFITRNEGNYLLSGAVYLIFGTLWWFWIGRGIGYVVKKIQARFSP